MVSCVNVMSLRLFHFTHRDNLQQIFTQGLRCLADIEANVQLVRRNDIDRLDRRFAPGGGICLSIGHTPTFFHSPKLQNQKHEYAILEISPKILLGLPELIVCPTNASSSEISAEFERGEMQIRRGEYVSYRGIGDALRQRNAINLLFADQFRISGDQTTYRRSDLGYLAGIPNDPQSEIILFDSIPANRLTRVHVQNEKIMRTVESLPNVPGDVRVSPGLFESRDDWLFWNGKRLNVNWAIINASAEQGA